MLDALSDVDDDDKVRFWAEELKKVKDGKGGVASFVNSDCRWSYKKKGEPFLGYKAHVSCDGSGIVTSAQLLAGNEPEGERMEDLLNEDRRKGIRAKSVTADKAYDSARKWRAHKADARRLPRAIRGAASYGRHDPGHGPCADAQDHRSEDVALGYEHPGDRAADLPFP